MSLPKETLQVSNELLTSDQKFVDSSETPEDSSQATVETLCSPTFTRWNLEDALNLKAELENLKLQIIAEIKDLIFNEISSFKDSWNLL